MPGKRRPTHPGEVLMEDVIKPLGLTVTEAAARLGVSWLYMQAKLDLWNVAKKPPKVQELKAAAV